MTLWLLVALTVTSTACRENAVLALPTRKCITWSIYAAGNYCIHSSSSVMAISVNGPDQDSSSIHPPSGALTSSLADFLDPSGHDLVSRVRNF